MILKPADIADLSLLSAEVAVVGAGPAGIVVALELAERGIDVVVVESGGDGFSARAQALSDAAAWDHELHAPMSMTVRRQIGGTSSIWGGRCVPYDPIDFDTRKITGNAEWPVSYEDLETYFQRACDWFQCGRAEFDARRVGGLADSIVPSLEDTYALTSTLERWSLPTNFGHTYRRRLEEARQLRLVTGLTCTEIVCRAPGSSVDYLECRGFTAGAVRVKALHYVIAAGGLESTRLLLASRAPAGSSIGDHSGHLGRWYMAHVQGVIANVRFSTEPRDTIFWYERDDDGVYVRRRFSFTRQFLIENDLPNIVGWIANPAPWDASHQSAVLSFVYLALASPAGRYFAPDAMRLAMTGQEVPGSPYGHSAKSSVEQHLRNVLSNPAEAALFATNFGARRFLARKRRAPGFFVYRGDNLYPFQYHAEHLPNAESRVTLSDRRDALGLPMLNIGIAFSDEDVRGVVRAHQLWDKYLREQGCGRLEYLSDDPEAAVRPHRGGGFHQIGTTRMARDSRDGVLDENLFVHGIKNLAVVSSSAFVTSGQANSTFMVVAFGLRLADRLTKALTTHFS